LTQSAKPRLNEELLGEPSPGHLNRNAHPGTHVVGGLLREPSDGPIDRKSRAGIHIAEELFGEPSPGIRVGNTFPRCHSILILVILLIIAVIIVYVLWGFKTLYVCAYHAEIVFSSYTTHEYHYPYYQAPAPPIIQPQQILTILSNRGGYFELR